MREITTNKNILNENSPLLQAYFKDINRYPIYSGDEQIELARKCKKGDEIAREKLIESNLKFIVTCAKQFSGQGVPLMDLIQYGVIGLIQSIDNFDPDRGYKFISFAVWYIRREMLRAIYNTKRTIRYPITYISKISKVKRAYDNFYTKYQREPTDEELIKLANISQKQYNSVLFNSSQCQSLDAPVTDDGKTKVEDVIPDEIDNESVFAKDTIRDCLRYLNKREQKVIIEFYGLDGVEKPIKEIARELRLGEERVRQLRKGAIKKLYRRCGNILKTLL